ncbi:linamarin synthase 2 [Quercus suber]|uniref:Linamarin synthase 2 n=1 Tax=Quercus suber TaxID=58331 RepID=A0AAW0MBK7_QUESU
MAREWKKKAMKAIDIEGSSCKNFERLIKEALLTVSDSNSLKIGSMGSKETPKPHAVFLPYPSQGHVTPMMRLAKLLHSRGFHITFVNTEFNHRRLIRSKGLDYVKGLPDFRFETIPDGLPPSDRDATQDLPALCDSARKNCLAPFKELVLKLNSSESEVPLVTCMISDGFMSFAIKAGEELGIPEVQFWTASACGFLGYLYFTELIKRGIIPFKDESFKYDGTLETPISWIPGMKNIRLMDLPSFIRTTDITEILFDYAGSETRNCLNSSAIIFNTFDELEHDIGVEVNKDVKHDEIEVLVKEMMEGEKGKAARQKASEWKKKAMEATDIEGSSYKNFERLIKEALLIEFEHDVLEEIAAKFPRIYNIGQLPLQERHLPESQFMSLSASLWKEDSKCLQLMA